jgi:hypothetical protein
MARAEAAGTRVEPAEDGERPAAGDPTWERLEQQIGWYDSRSNQNQRRFKWCKYTEIVAAAAIPVSTGVGGPATIGAVLGGVILALEGVQHLNQYQQNWITYRSTAEALKHEKYLYLAGAAHYGRARDDAHALLAERVEGLVSQEHAQWVSARDEAARSPGDREK